MPELPEVEIVKQSLDQKIRDKKIYIEYSIKCQNYQK